MINWSKTLFICMTDTLSFNPVHSPPLSFITLCGMPIMWAKTCISWQWNIIVPSVDIYWLRPVCTFLGELIYLVVIVTMARFLLFLTSAYMIRLALPPMLWISLMIQLLTVSFLLGKTAIDWKCLLWNICTGHRAEQVFHDQLTKSSP